MSRVKWSRKAQTDIAGIDDHYHALNPDYAARVARLAVKAAHFLCATPDAGPVVGMRLRKWRVTGTPYLLFYRPEGASIRIVRVVHAARDWRALFEP